MAELDVFLLGLLDYLSKLHAFDESMVKSFAMQSFVSISLSQRITPMCMQ